jgi:hypothetical protein
MRWLRRSLLVAWTSILLVLLVGCINPDSVGVETSSESPSHGYELVPAKELDAIYPDSVAVRLDVRVGVRDVPPGQALVPIWASVDPNPTSDELQITWFDFGEGCPARVQVAYVNVQTALC